MAPEKKFIDWEERYSLGIPHIDNQHMQLLDIVNDLHKACCVSDSQAMEQFRTALRDTAAYVKTHFSSEEQIMEKFAYPEISEHKKIHAEFAQEILGIAVSFEEGKKLVPNNFVRFLKDYILSHVAITDAKLAVYILELQNTGKMGKNTIRRKNEDNTERKIILAIDDSKTQLSVYKNNLPMYDVYTCESAKPALEIIKAMEIDVILLDLAMPDISGFDFLQYLRKNQEQPNVPVIVVSGKNTEKYILASKNYGANDFIAKPVDPELLKQKILKQLEITDSKTGWSIKS